MSTVSLTVLAGILAAMAFSPALVKADGAKALLHRGDKISQVEGNK